MAVFRDSHQPLSESLSKTASSITGKSVTVRQLFELIGEQGLLMFCLFLAIPFLVPVSIPGVSTVFGILILLIGISVTFNRLPWLPDRLMNRQVETEHLIPALQKGAQLVHRIDRLIRPRFLMLTDGMVVNRFNGLMLVFGALLLMVPFGFVPFSNTLPALAILFLVVGILQRDGLFIFGGYLMNIVTVIYFGVLVVGAIAAGAGLSHLIGS